MEDAFARPVADVLKHFGVTAEGGLTDARVAEQLAKYGKNGALGPPLLRAQRVNSPRVTVKVLTLVG